MNRLPEFVAEASLKPSGSAYRGAAGRATVAATVVAARIARQTTYGCGIDWHTNSVCCRFWQPGRDVVVCCPRDGSGPCASYPGLLSASPTFPM
jgi:hypothetical protein